FTPRWLQLRCLRLSSSLLQHYTHYLGVVTCKMAEHRRATRERKSGSNTENDSIPSSQGSPAGTSLVREAPAAKRRRILEQLGSTAPRKITCANDLDEIELQELYKIADCFVKAHGRNHRATAATVESLINVVFKFLWTPDGQNQPNLLESSSMHAVAENQVGNLVNGTLRRPVFLKLEFAISPGPKVMIGLVDIFGAEIRFKEFRDLEWNSSGLESATKDLADIRNQFIQENTRRAVRYARQMICSRSKGEGLPRMTEQYEFVDMEHFYKMCPMGVPRDGTLAAIDSFI
ncbi:hypothetical protein TOPH_06348, partial [Tolypocladium ophioglossoides CBS 100239]